MSGRPLAQGVGEWAMKTAMDEALEDVRHYYDLWIAAERREARLREELEALRERCKPTSPPYLACLWHAGFDHTCPFCLRHRLAECEAASGGRHEAE